MSSIKTVMVCVAPSRGRGLKLQPDAIAFYLWRVAPSRGRGLKHRFPKDSRAESRRPLTGARIETLVLLLLVGLVWVAPSRGRGLKLCFPTAGAGGRGSPPHGGAD